MPCLAGRERAPSTKRARFGCANDTRIASASSGFPRVRESQQLVRWLINEGGPLAVQLFSRSTVSLACRLVVVTLPRSDAQPSSQFAHPQKRCRVEVPFNAAGHEQMRAASLRSDVRKVASVAPGPPGRDCPSLLVALWRNPERGCC